MCNKIGQKRFVESTGTIRAIVFSGKIISYGFCDSACRDERQGFMFASLNILTDEECTTLFEYQIAKAKKNNMDWNAEYEICTGKKNKFPKNPVHLVRSKKGKKKQEAEKVLAKKCQ